MKKATFLLLFLSIIVLSLGFELTLKEKRDLKHGWKFSKNRQFHYFSNTQEIAHSLVPVKINSLPEKRGVWLLRHKDFLDLPDSFSGIEKDEHGPASIQYVSSAIFFSSIRIKLFVFGDVDLNLLTNAGNDVIGLGSGNKQLRFLQKGISLGGEHYKNCSNVDDSADSNFRWVTYGIHMSDGATKMELQVIVSNPKSFVILDEIDIIYTEPAISSPTDDTFNWSEERISPKHQMDGDEDAVSIRKKLYRVHCSVDE